MGAYAAVTSLKHTINGLEMLEFAYNESTSLQQALERLKDSSSKKRRVDGQIKLEDVLEFHELKSQEEEVMRKEKEYIEEDDESDHDAAVVDFGVEMVAHSTLFNTILDHLKEVVTCILGCTAFGIGGEDEEMICNCLERRRYMIVLDDVRSSGLLDELISSSK